MCRYTPMLRRSAVSSHARHGFRMRSHFATSMIRVTVLRVLVLLLLLLPLLTSAADPGAPVLQLEGLMERQQGIQELSRWGEDRLIDGIGWKIASAARGDDDGGLKGL